MALVIKNLSARAGESGVGRRFLLQGTFLTQGSNLLLLHLLHWQADSFTTVLPEKPSNTMEHIYLVVFFFFGALEIIVRYSFHRVQSISNCNLQIASFL